MKKSIVTMLVICSGALLFTGCKKKSGDVWDDSQGLGSYKRASERVLWGSPNETQVAANETSSSFSSKDEDFIPLQEEDLKQQFADLAVPQPKDSPGEFGSSLPGIDGFHAPSADLASVFKTLHFNTDEYVLKNPEDQEAVNRIASYLKAHAHTYIFVAGHCDQRGPEAYNLALGSKRANYIRSLLVQKGVDPDQIHTVSYGKEKLADYSNNASAWSANRRAEFKIYQQR